MVPGFRSIPELGRSRPARPHWLWKAYLPSLRVLICSGGWKVASRVSISPEKSTNVPSSVIFHRLRLSPKVCLLCYFFNFSSQEQTAEDVIRILLKQALLQLPKIPSDVQAEYARYKRDPHNALQSREKHEALL